MGAFATPQQYKESVYKELLKEETNSLLVGFACVGNCGSEPVKLAIEEGVELAEKETGKQKPVLLCLMGDFGSVKTKENETARTFPSFMFPESAAHALGKIVNYVKFKRKPAGNLVWFEDAKANEARELIIEKIKDKKDEEFLLDAETARKIFELFNIETTEEKTGASISITVTPDNLFGPIITVVAPDKTKSVRITPLMEKDLEEIREEIGVILNPKFDEIVGKVSQMIEEIPWLWELEIQVYTNVCKISDSITMKLKSGKIKRPDF